MPVDTLNMCVLQFFPIVLLFYSFSSYLKEKEAKTAVCFLKYTAVGSISETESKIAAYHGYLLHAAKL